MHLVSAFTEDQDEINYEEFMALVERHGGDFGGHDFKFQQAASDRMSGRGGLSHDSRELITRVKQAVNQASGGMVGLEQALRKNSANGGVAVQFDQFLVALSRTNVSLTLDDIKDFFALLQGRKGRQDEPVQVAEILQILSL